MILSLSTRHVEPDITVIELSGRIAIGRESGQIETVVNKELAAGARKLVIDMSQVHFIDSTGIGIIAYCFGRVTQAHAEARVAGATGLVMDVFRLTRLDAVLKFVPTVEDAIASFEAQ